MSTKNLTCGLCLRLFDSTGQLQHHVDLVHFACTICDLSHPRSTLASHYQNNHNVHVCEVCYDHFTVENDLKTHISQAHRPMTCTMCNVEVTDINEHVKSAHSKTFECDECQERFQTLVQLSNHKQFNHGSSLCTKCYKPLVEQCQHIKTIDNWSCRLDPQSQILKQDPRRACQHCGVSYQFQKDLLRHLAVHNNPSPEFPVPSPRLEMSDTIAPVSITITSSCGSPRKSPLKASRKAPSSRGRKPLQCSICSKHFVLIESARKHLSLVHRISQNPDKYISRKSQQPQVPQNTSTTSDTTNELSRKTDNLITSPNPSREVGKSSLNNEPTKSWLCGKCNTNLPSGSYLIAHVKKCQNVMSETECVITQVYSCQDCNFKATDVDSVKSHAVFTKCESESPNIEYIASNSSANASVLAPVFQFISFV